MIIPDEISDDVLQNFWDNTDGLTETECLEVLKSGGHRLVIEVLVNNLTDNWLEVESWNYDTLDFENKVAEIEHQELEIQLNKDIQNIDLSAVKGRFYLNQLPHYELIEGWPHEQDNNGRHFVTTQADYDYLEQLSDSLAYIKANNIKTDNALNYDDMIFLAYSHQNGDLDPNAQLDEYHSFSKTYMALNTYLQDDTKAYVQAIISLETGINDFNQLNKMYHHWIEDKDGQLISPEWTEKYLEETELKTEDKKKGRTR